MVGTEVAYEPPDSVSIFSLAKGFISENATFLL